MHIRRACGSAMVVALALGGLVNVAAATAGNERLTKKQWVSSANRICRETDDLIDELDEPTASITQELTPEQFDEIADYTEAAHGYSEDAFIELRALRPPKKGEAKVRRITRALAEGVAAISDANEAALAGDQAALEAALNEAAARGDDFEAASKAYGSTCGRSSEPGAGGPGS